MSDDEDETPDHSGSWDVDALVAKAQRYAEKMVAADRDGWEFALWSSLSLEFLLRAALCDYDPALLADTKDVNNLLSAVGIQPKAKKFIPKSIGTKDVVDRLVLIVPEFTTELAGFSLKHTTNRNAELHSGQNAFEGKKHSSWLPLYYKTCKVLAEDLGRDLADFFDQEEVKTAEKLISAHNDGAAKAVKATINAHATVWRDKDQAEKTKLTGIAQVWATKYNGHRVKCPACQCDAIVIGDPISSPRKSIQGDIITEKQEYLPNKFECIACGMKISGLSQLTASGLGDTYVSTQSFDANEYYSTETEEDEWDGYEPDNNE